METWKPIENFEGYLDKISDVTLRNKVLEKIGTKDFAWNLQQAIEKETSEKNKALIIAEVEKFATQIKDVTGYKYFKSYYPSRDVEVVAPDDIDIVEYFFSITEYGYITLYIKATDDNASSSQTPAWLEKQIERDARRAVMDEVSKRAYKLRRKFVKDVSSAVAKKNIGNITEFLLWSTIKCSADISLKDLASFFDIKIEEEEDEDFFNSCFSIVAEHIHDQPERHLLAAAYLLTDSPREKYCSWDNQFKDNETLNAVYDFLEKLGYEISEEESAMRDGTHELFVSADDVSR